MARITSNFGIKCPFTFRAGIGESFPAALGDLSFDVTD